MLTLANATHTYTAGSLSGRMALLPTETRAMPSPSFRFILLASFLLVAGLLGAVAASGWMSLADFANRGRRIAHDAIGLTTALQQLGERTVDMERSARQFLVLRDAALQRRFVDARHSAIEALTRIEHLLPGSAPLIAEWRDLSSLGIVPEDAQPAPALVADKLRRLTELNETLTRRVAASLDRANASQLDALDHKREQLAALLLSGVALTSALGLLIAWWILRPLRQLAGAITALGENRLQQPIAVHGPADLRQLGERLDWLRLRLADLEANRNRVLRHVSHELKTPLASLREGVALLADQVPGPLKPAQREVTDILAGNTRTLQERIEQLLDYNASQFDAAKLALQPTALHELAAGVLTELRLPAQGKDVHLRLEGDATTFALDAEKMRIVLSNLVNNAIAYSPPGGEIRLVLTAGAGISTIDCMDQGPGVAPDDAERIFEPFVRGPAAERHGKGSGLGLAIVREFVRAHGGRVAVLPASHGAHFRIELPHG